MNRRALLKGLVASTALTVCPAVVKATLAVAPVTDEIAALRARYEQWYRDSLPILSEIEMDFIIFGAVAWRETEAYPFIARVDPCEILNSRDDAGLLAQSMVV